MAGERAEHPHRTDSANPGEDLLDDPVVLVAAIEPVGDSAQVVRIILDV
jgi:hypothetical protein